MKPIVLVALLLLLPQFAAGKSQILCKTAGKSGDVIINLAATYEFKRKLNCISGDFISDMTPCAPSGGYSLSYPTGAASLLGVVDRWQDYADHMGGITSSSVSDAEINFAGGFNFPSSGYTPDWEFSVSRLTGVGVLKVKKKPPIQYKCSKANQKF